MGVQGFEHRRWMRRSLHRAGGGSRSGGVLETHLKDALNLIALSRLQAPLPLKQGPSCRQLLSQRGQEEAKC